MDVLISSHKRTGTPKKVPKEIIKRVGDVTHTFYLVNAIFDNASDSKDLSIFVVVMLVFSLR
jgi:hypothetical protein